jgi:MoaA/NifB/PqqE/SkfB family radical SAM enzyme
VPTKSFDLLTVEQTNGLSHQIEAKGFLAEQTIDLCEKHPGLMKAAAAAARLMRQRELHLIGLEVTADPETRKVSARATGPLAYFLRKEVNRVVGNINRYHSPIAMHNGGFVYTLYQPPVPSARMVNAMSRVIVRGREPIYPTTCTLQVTARCQLDCAHCSAARFKTRERDELTTEEWKSVLRQSVDLGIYNIVFTGGEPLLRKDICELVAAVDSRRANAMMFTNGLLLTEENVDRLRDAGLFSVMVSLDDPRPEEHNRLRGRPNCFQDATAGIKNALEVGLLVGISTYAGPDDVRSGRTEQMIELARAMGVHEITIFDVVPTGKLLPLQQKQLLSHEDKDQLIELERHYNELEDYPHIITQAFINGPLGVGCFAARVQYYMTTYGDVTPCDFTPLTFGNVRDDRLEEIWDRMLAHPAYCQPSDHCRMQDPEFRRKYIDDIPGEGLLPWPATEQVVSCTPHGPHACRVCAATPAAH